MTGPEGNGEFCFPIPRISMFPETKSNNVIKISLFGRDPASLLCRNKIDEVVFLCKLKILTDASVFSLLSPVLSSRLCYSIIRGLRRGEYVILCSARPATS